MANVYLQSSDAASSDEESFELIDGRSNGHKEDDEESTQRPRSDDDELSELKGDEIKSCEQVIETSPSKEMEFNWEEEEKLWREERRPLLEEKEKLEEELKKAKEDLDREKNKVVELERMYKEMSCNYYTKSAEVRKLEVEKEQAKVEALKAASLASELERAKMERDVMSFANGELLKALERMKTENEMLKAEIEKSKSADNRVKLETRTVSFRTGVDGYFGIRHRGASITKVDAGWPADLQGVKGGDQIISIDGINVEKLSKTDISRIFKKARVAGNLTMVLRYASEHQRAVEPSCTGMASDTVRSAEKEDPGNFGGTRKVTLERDENGKFGIRYMGTFIDKVYEDSSAKVQGVKKGDEIVSIDGIEVEMLSRENIEVLMEESNGNLVLRFNPERHRDLKTDWNA